MGVRKNQNKLTSAEKARFVNAVKRMKADGKYDPYASIHANAFAGDADTNPAHMGPAFFPWHRHFLALFEKDLQDADRALGQDGSVTLPYWDWTHDNGDRPNRQRGSIWRDDFMGGFGSPVTTGPFRQGQWTLSGGGSLVRALGRASIDPNTVATLPDRSQVNQAMGIAGFDHSPWDINVTGPAVGEPAAPALTGAAGGSLAPGAYRVSVTLVNPRGETRPSPEATITLGPTAVPANTHGTIRVASPPASGSATHFNVYVSAANGPARSGTRQGAALAIGTQATIASLAAGAALPTINTTGSFRNVLEGWAGASGPENHNRVHVWVGGSMAPGTSPDDPIFFLHHCNIDRLWALWQFRHPGQNYPLIVPRIGSPGNRPHGLNDPMPPWTAGADLKRPIDVLNHTALGYTYDTDPVGASINVSP
ncbi:tyrosinase family protein [Sorangium sp. So ce233]|uniref:tyrosinase family protein n=1 Tax=Sorangium sp. So ce233 TaxID=3133290 RepID=UPI003F5FE634